MARQRGRLAAAATSVLLVAVVAVPVVAALGAEGAGVPPPTPVPVPGGGTSPSPFPTVLHTPTPSSTRPPEVSTGSAILADLDSGQVLLDRDGSRRRSIASITKIMTALLAVRRSDPSDIVTVPPDAASSGRTVGVSELGLVPGERISVQDLLYALLLQSANDAAVAIADHVSGSTASFVRAMNAQASRLGMQHTRFFSPNGLDDRGYSTAADLVRLTRAVYAYPLIERIATTEFHEISSPAGPPREIQNRNVLLWLYPGTIGLKTGYTSSAGFCVVAVAAREGVRLVAVVLGARGEPFSEAAALLDYGFAAFERRTLVSAGEAIGSVTIQGRRVSVASGRSLVGLVPVDARIRRRVILATGVRFPPDVGEPVASLVVSAGDLRLGRVALVVTSVPPPPPPSPGPWWARAGRSLVHAVSSLLGALFN